jgi:hypothetical protein
LTDPLLLGRSIPAIPCKLEILGVLNPDLVWLGPPRVGPKLEPRPAVVGGGEATRENGGSTLTIRLRRVGGDGVMISFGIAGTGGASARFGRGEPRLGDGSRKVRSVMEDVLPRRSSPPGRPCTDPPLELPTEETEPLRMVRFVWTSATEVGVIGLARRAAAAAAADKDPFEVELLMKACAAAVCAFEFTWAP